jgi:hypothetical protein
MLRLLVPVLVMALSPLAAQAQSCSQGDIKQAAAAMDAARSDLRALPLGDGMVSDESPRAQATIAAMKARIGIFVSAYMHCAPQAIAAKTAQSDLSRLGHAGGPEPERPDADYYGLQLGFEVRRAALGLVAVTTDFSVECGSDTVLAIFARRDGAWREVLRDQAAPYKTVAGAFDSFDYAISPPDATGHWFVVTTSVAPWCSSNWSMIRYAVLRPSPDAAAPRTIFSAQDSIFREDQDSRLAVGVDNFDLRFHAESIDDAIFTREWLRHFSVVGDKVRRIPPLADTPRDFADEWIVSQWSEARQWTAPEAASRLEAIHAELNKNKSGLGYASIRSCRQGATQIEIRPQDSDTMHYYLLVSGNRDFAMTDVSRAPDPFCRGKNLFDPNNPK